MFEQVAGMTIRVDSEGIEAADSALENLERQGGRTEKSTKKVESSMKSLNSSSVVAKKGIGGFGNRSQQVSYQLQDMVVQAQMGTNAFTILGQQGSQLASAFGPGGAVIGTVIALASAVGGTLAASFFNAGNEAEEMQERIEQAVGSSLRVKVRENQENIDFQVKQILQLKKDLQSAEDDFNGPVNVAAKVRRDEAIAKAKEGKAKSLAAAQQTLIDAEERLVQLREKQIKLEDDLSGRASEKKISTKITEQVEKIRQDGLSPEEQEREKHSARLAIIKEFRAKGLDEDKKFDSLEKDEKARHNAVLIDLEKNKGKALEQIKREDAQRFAQLEKDAERIRASGLDPVQREKEQHERNLVVLEQYWKRRMKNTAEYQRQAEAEKQRHEDAKSRIERDSANQNLTLITSSQETALSATGQLFGNMAAIMAEGGKDSFDEYKAFASAQAGVSAALAIIGALAVQPAPLGIALAGTIGGLAAFQIAKIQGMEYQGRAMGGQVLSGQSYVVGERGPEVLTMGGNGSITPNHQLGNGPATPMNVTQVFQIATGVAGTVQAEIRKQLPAIRQMAVQGVQAAIASGGNMSRSVGAR